MEFQTAGNIPPPLTMRSNGDIDLAGSVTLSRTCQVTFATGETTVPETISEAAEVRTMDSLGVTPDDIEQGRQATRRLVC
eukprot:3243480-Amphidinium_carterae.2